MSVYNAKFTREIVLSHFRLFIQQLDFCKIESDSIAGKILLASEVVAPTISTIFRKGDPEACFMYTTGTGLDLNLSFLLVRPFDSKRHVPSATFCLRFD